MNSRLKNYLVATRNTVIHFFYKFFLKPFLFLLDPEDVHNWFVLCGKFLGRFYFYRQMTGLYFGFSDKMLEQNVAGVYFRNPVGLAGGFDKDAELLRIMPSVGFGFSEVGSITALPCAGNPRPRLWRLPKSNGLVVYYGLKNRGVVEISERLKKQIAKKKFEIPVVTNIAMTNCSANLDTTTAIADYAKSFSALSDVGEFFTINVSCPNATGGQPFMNPDKMDLLLTELDKLQTTKPIFVKISPDASLTEVDFILDVLKKHRVNGIVCGNLTKKKNNPLIVENLPPVGGVSGKPAEELSNTLISHIYRREGKKFIIIGCGGIFSATDAYKKIRAGATLVELITGMIFEGPQVISEINRGLIQLLHRDGFKNISEAIGADCK
jgi:dihydroorotate dehydrogenase